MKGMLKKLFGFYLVVAMLVSPGLAGAADDSFAVVGDYYGGAGYIGFDNSGNINLQPIVSSKQINYGSYGIGLGDFDNDGLVDYLIGGQTGYYYGTVKIEFHKKTGPGNSFAPGVPISAPTNWYYYVMDFAVADYNNDGNMDFAVNDYYSRRVQVYMGNGDGTFKNPTSYSVPFNAIGMDAEDLNGDGNADFVVLQYNWSTSLRAQVFLGDGQGGFTAQTATFASPSYYPWGITLSDFDGDGNADMVVSNSYTYYYDNYMVSFFKGNGDGTFQPTPKFSGEIPSGYYGQYAPLDNFDFNQDGKMDIIMSLPNNRAVLVYLGNGDGTFTGSAQQPQIFQGTYSYSISTVPFQQLKKKNRAPVAVIDAPTSATTDNVNMDVDPDTLNLASNGQWVTAYLLADDKGDAAVILDGSGSSDEDGDALTYAWTVTGDNGSVLSLDGKTVTADLQAGAYTIQLVVNDGKVDSEPVSSELTVSLINVASLNPAELQLNGVVGSRSEFQDPKLMVKFDRAAFAGTVPVGDAIKVFLYGSAVGEDSIRVISNNGGLDKGKKK